MATRGKKLSQDLKDLIIKLYKESNSQRKIARTINKSSSTVQKITEKYNSEGSTENKPRPGRPKIFTAMEEKMIVQKDKVNPKVSAAKIQSEVERDVGKSCNPETIRRVLHKAGYHGRSIRKKPLISQVNRQKRINFAKKHINEPNSFWNTVIFSDETKFNIHGSDGRDKVWRKTNAELEPKNMAGTVKHGGGLVLVWGCMTASGVGRLVFIDGTMDKYLYLDILRNNLKESAVQLGLNDSFILLHTPT